MTNKQEQWEIEFDEKWNKSFLGSGFDSVEGKRKTPIKQFIQDLLSQTRQEAIEEIIAMVEHELKILGQINLSTGGRKYVKPQALSLMKLKNQLNLMKEEK